MKHRSAERGVIDQYDSSALLTLLDITPEQYRKAALTLARHARDADDLRELLYAAGLLHDPDVKPRPIY